MPWSDPAQILRYFTRRRITVAVLGNRLYMIHVDQNNNRLWFSSFDGINWGTPQIIRNHLSNKAPALTVFQNRLHMVHIGRNKEMWHSTFSTRTGWSTPVMIQGQKSKDAPSMVATNRIHMVHLGKSSNNIWYSRFDGNAWSSNVKIENHSSTVVPELVVFQNRVHMFFHSRISQPRRHLRRTFYRHSILVGNNWNRQPNSPIFGIGQITTAVYGNRLHLIASSFVPAQRHSPLRLNVLRYRQFDGNAWSADAIIDNISSSTPILFSFANILQMIHYQSKPKTIFQSVWNGNFGEIRIGVKFNTNTAVPPSLPPSITAWINALNSLMNGIGITVVPLTQEILNIPTLYSVDVGTCRKPILFGDGTTSETRALFSNRLFLGQRDIGVYFVDSISRRQGCARHPNGRPACVLVLGSVGLLLPHELGHVLGLSHTSTNNNFMRRTISSTDTSVTCFQIQRMFDSVYCYK